MIRPTRTNTPQIELIGIGTAQPARFAQRDAAVFAAGMCCRTEKQRRMLPRLFDRTQVETRGSVLVAEDLPGGTVLDAAHPKAVQSFYDRAGTGNESGPTTHNRMKRYEADALPLALSAARDGLSKAGTNAADITHLVTVSCTGFAAPGVDVGLMRSLRLRPDVERTHIGFMGCHGAFNALRVAQAFAARDAAARVLVVAVELCSLHFQYGWEPQNLVANALFADGAAAVVVGQTQATSADRWRLIDQSSRVFPDSESAMSWRIEDHGFVMTLSPRVPHLIEKHVPRWLDDWLAPHHLTLSDIPSWAVHPGGPRIVSSVLEGCGLPEGAGATSQAVLRDCGNMSSPTILFILKKLRDQGATGPCVALGFGPGLTGEAMLLH